ncbi:NAD(P)-dependent oxidoreductase [Crocinitomicaceae bacterium]|nr:NAD(P)-dependent oxidoreductase [Crocinitomicaceae bacterium]|tara:strand:+ start:3156 stop:4223 length:1068 start_codon:yes stop_codon:yes gene_type:complete
MNEKLTKIRISIMIQQKVLMTGGTGAIGLQLLKQMQAENRLDQISVLVRDSKTNRKKLKAFGNKLTVHFGDITNLDSVKKAVKGKDVVIHLAALIPTVEDSNDALVTRVNVGGTENVVRAMESESPNAFLLFSSSVAIYGDRIKGPDIKVTDPPKGLEHDNYSKTKVDAEAIIMSSKLNWSIFRLSAIMGIGNHKVSGIMFDVPLETKMEISTVKDTANGFVCALDKQSVLNHQIFNLAGGKQCQLTYKEFLTKAFHSFGMGQPNFHEFAFAKQNFHCGYYQDSDILENLIHFRSDSVETYFKRFRASVPTVQRISTIPFAGVVKWYLQTLSAPLNAYKKRDQEKIKFFFGNIEA